MFWLIAIAITLLGSVATILFSGAANWSVHVIAEIVLVWSLAWFFGVITVIAGLQHIFNSDRIADYIGWEKGSGFQLELGWAEVGIGLTGILTIWLRGTYVIAPVIAGSLFYLGAAFVHARDMIKTGNFSAGSAGPVFYIDIIMPVICVLACVVYFVGT